MSNTFVIHEPQNLPQFNVPITRIKLKKKLETIVRIVKNTNSNLPEPSQILLLIPDILTSFKEEIDFLYTNLHNFLTPQTFKDIDYTNIELFKWLNAENYQSFICFQYSLILPFDYSIGKIYGNDEYLLREQILIKWLNYQNNHQAFEIYKNKLYISEKYYLMVEKTEKSIKEWISYHLFKYLKTYYLNL